ncbi:MFS transporter [Desulfosporosinus meridiei]|uniref:Fucose permease n=1 Tax=Desulfosporosinus meridiei (strain ATCC BAA-275 / DSM 13257 / KCTC 12902 / NCIMB 13706 / S10) TaxID=768704 RepID=J7IVV4_DESMD|nr:MFS transporter [Desulfosporosinus meridiei]AFQ42816.1 fucose permease [Desulfosporosinus meridiei DSM 13257]
MLDLIGNRLVRAILGSALFLQIGIWVRNFAVLLFVMEQTNGNALAISMISVAEYTPIFIFSFIGGTFADRWRPKRTMIWCDILSAISVFGVLGTLVFGTWKAVFFTTIISAILSQFSQPSGMKLIKEHLPPERIQAVMSIYQTIFTIFMILGPILGTFVYHKFGIMVSISIMGLAFLLSAGSLTFLPVDSVSAIQKPVTTLGQEMKAGIHYVLAKKTLTLLGLCFLAAGLGGGLVQPLGIFLITERLGLPKESLQWLMTFNGLGMLAGGIIVMIFAKAISPQKLLAFGMFISAIGLAICGFSTFPWLTYLVHLLMGLVLPCIMIGINMMMLQNSDNEFIGRVNGILMPLYTGAMVLTMSMAGVLKEMFTLVAMYEAAGVLYIVGLLFLVPLFNAQSAKGTIFID